MRQLRRLVPYLQRKGAALALGMASLLGAAVCSAASPWVLKHAVDDLTVQVTTAKLYTYAALLVAVVVVEGAFRYTTRRTLIGMSREVEFDLRNDVFGHLTRLEPAYYQAHRIGDLMSRATNDLSAVRMVLGPGIMYTATTVATFVAAVVLMVRISPVLLGLSLLPLLLVSWLVRHFGRRIHDRFEQAQAELANMNTVVQEGLAGIRVVRAYAQEEHERQRFARVNEDYLVRNRTLTMLSGALYPGIQLLMGLGAVAVLWLGGRLVVGGAITLGDFVAFTAYLAMLHWPMIAFGWVVNIFERGEAAMGRIAEILDATPGIRDESAMPLAASVRGEIEFRGLDLSLDGRPVLQDVDLRVPAGALVAVVGPTGSGKSTLVSLLPRLLDPPAGTLFLDGRDVRTLPLAQLRSAIGFVPQEPFLFSTTVRDNIALGVPGAPDGQVEAAAATAQLARDVADFPHAFDTAVGERGITLSGGQKQRTALARALATEPRVLVLDDAFSSVDTETEERILHGLRRYAAGRTTFLVSHRVSTVKDADIIVVLRDGRVAEKGTHQSLVDQDGFYADLHRRQLLEREVESA